MYNIFLIPSSINGYLGYFHVVHGIIRVGHDLGTKQWELNVCHCKEHYDQHLATIIIFRPGFLPDICQGVRLMDHSVQFSSVLNRVGLFGTPWTAACQASLSITNSRSSLKLMSIESVMPSSHLILCRPFTTCLQSLPASGSFPMSQLFAWGGQSTGVSASASVLPKNTQDWSPLGTSIFSIQLWKCCTQFASKFGKLSSGHRTGKGQFSFQSQRKAMPKNAQTTAQLHSSHMLVK